jgi:hypothetical protein
VGQPARLRLSGYGAAAFSRVPRAKAGGARRDRTDDLKLAKLALSQLSYGPRLRLSGFGAASPLCWMACRAVARGNRPAFARWAPARQPSLAFRERRLVEPTGIEPVTSSLQS